MKARIPLLIAAGLFFATLTKAQYQDRRDDDRNRAENAYNNAYNYNHGDHDRYDDHRDRDHDRYDDHNNRYDNRRDVYYGRGDWRAVEYDRYCREHRNCRIDRDDFYRNPYYYIPRPLFPPQPVVYFRF